VGRSRGGEVRPPPRSLETARQKDRPSQAIWSRTGPRSPERSHETDTTKAQRVPDRPVSRPAKNVLSQDRQTTFLETHAPL